MYERMHHPLLPRRHFARRVLRHLALASAIGGAALLLGMIGYHFLSGLSWLDSFVNASMILSGMGPLATLTRPAAKLFAGFYALFSGLVFIGIAGFITAPFAHRLLHHFHLEDAPEEDAS